MNPATPAAPTSRSDRVLVPLIVLAGIAGVVREFLPLPVNSGFRVLPNWAALVGVVAALITVLVSRRIPRNRAVQGALWGSSALLILNAADGIAFDIVGVIMKAVSVVTGEVQVVRIPVDPAGIAVRLLAGITGVLAGSRAVAYRRERRGSCLRCGRMPGGESRRPSAKLACLACALALGYATEKIYWGLGGTLGLADKNAFGDAHLWSPGLGDTALLALVGAGIALALARPQGNRVPRWLPMAGAGLGSMMLIPVGIIGTVANFSAPPSLNNGIGLVPWVFLIEYPWFFAWGVTLGLATLAFHYRTRGRCPLCDRGASQRFGIAENKCQSRHRRPHQPSRFSSDRARLSVGRPGRHRNGARGRGRRCYHNC